MNVKNILKDLVKIDTQFNKSNKSIIDYISNLLKEYECQIYKLDGVTLDIYNLVVKIVGENHDSPSVLVGHTDTVIAGEGWTSNPLDPLEQDEKIFGLGASDMKSGLAVMISSILNLRTKPFQDVYLIFDCDEEYMGRGGIDIMNKLKIENARVIVMEPTSHRIVVGQKGCIDLEIKTKGKAVHASIATIKNNKIFSANHKAIKICNALIEYEKIISNRIDGEYGCPTLSISYISGGSGAANTVSGECVIRLSRRLVPSENLQDVYLEMEKTILGADSSAEIIKLFWGAPFKISKDNNFLKSVEKISRSHIFDLSFGVKSGWTEAALFTSWGDTIIFGPGVHEMSHQSNEYCYLKDLEIFERIIKEILLNQMFFNE